MHSSSTYMHSSKQRNQPGPRRKICCTSRIANRTNTAKETAHTHTHWYVSNNKLLACVTGACTCTAAALICTAANNETNLVHAGKYAVRVVSSTGPTQQKKLRIRIKIGMYQNLINYLLGCASTAACTCTALSTVQQQTMNQPGQRSRQRFLLLHTERFFFF